MPYRRTARTEMRKAKTRHALLKAALDLVREGGFAGLTVGDLSSRVGIATGTVYRYFPSKEDLCLEVFRRACDREVAVAWEAARLEMTPDRRLPHAIRTVATRAMQGASTAYAMVAEPVGESLDRERRLYRAAWTDAFAHIIRAGIETGRFPAQDATVSAACITGGILEALVAPLSRRDVSGQEEAVARDTVEAIVRFSMSAVLRNGWEPTPANASALS